MQSFIDEIKWQCKQMVFRVQSQRQILGIGSYYNRLSFYCKDLVIVWYLYFLTFYFDLTTKHIAHAWWQFDAVQVPFSIRKP